VDLPELACDLAIAGCIEEIGENRVSVRVHVGAFSVPLQGLKFLNRVLLGHGELDLRFGRNQQFNLPSLRLDTKLQVSSRPDMASNRPYSRRSFPSSTAPSKPEIGTPDFRIVYEFPGGAATNDMTGFHDVTSIGNRQRQIDVLFNQ
jgi:hypothetical protein